MRRHKKTIRTRKEMPLRVEMLEDRRLLNGAPGLAHAILDVPALDPDAHAYVHSVESSTPVSTGFDVKSDHGSTPGKEHENHEKIRVGDTDATSDKGNHGKSSSEPSVSESVTEEIGNGSIGVHVGITVASDANGDPTADLSVGVKAGAEGKTVEAGTQTASGQGKKSGGEGSQTNLDVSGNVGVTGEGTVHAVVSGHDSSEKDDNDETGSITKSENRIDEKSGIGTGNTDWSSSVSISEPNGTDSSGKLILEPAEIGTDKVVAASSAGRTRKGDRALDQDVIEIVILPRKSFAIEELLPAQPTPLVARTGDGEQIQDARNPQGPELKADFAPFDPAVVEAAMRQFLDQVRDFRSSLLGSNLSSWLMAAAVVVGAGEVARRRMRRAVHDMDGPGSSGNSSSWWFPGLAEPSLLEQT